MSLAQRAFIISSTILLTVLVSIYFKNSTESIFLTDTQNPHQTLIKELPEFKLKNVRDNQLISSREGLSTNEDELLVVHFWGTWCAPCEAEVPSLLKFVQSLNSYPIKFVFIAVKDKLKDLKKYMAKMPSYSNSIIQLYDSSDEIMKVFGMSKVPETFIFSAKNRLLLKHYVGPQQWNNVYYKKEILNL